MSYNTRNKQPRSSPGEDAGGQKKSKQMEVCPICTEDLIIDTTIDCSECNETFHIKCVDMSQKYYNYHVEECEKPYFCGPCTTGKISNFSCVLNDIKSDMMQQLSETFDRSVKQSMSAMHTSLTKLIEVKESRLRGEITGLKGEFRQLSERFTNIQLNNSSTHHCDAMDRIENLTKRNNVVITGVPKLKGENLKSVAVNVASLCSHLMKETEIEAAYRIQPKSSKPDAYNAPIVVKFVTFQSKTDFYSAYVKKMKSKQFITSHMLGHQAKSHIYVNTI